MRHVDVERLTLVDEVVAAVEGVFCAGPGGGRGGEGEEGGDECELHGVLRE